MIFELAGKWAALHDYALSPVKLDGVEYQTVRHAYEAAKTMNEEQRAVVAHAATPGIAEQLGRYNVDVRPDWEDVRLSILADLLRQKFSGRTLKALLLETGDEEIVYMNGDDLFLGSRYGTGENHMGRLMMELRESLRKSKAKTTVAESETV